MPYLSSIEREAMERGRLKAVPEGIATIGFTCRREDSSASPIIDVAKPLARERSLS